MPKYFNPACGMDKELQVANAGNDSRQPGGTAQFLAPIAASGSDRLSQSGCDSSNLAYLILAHHQPNHLARLIRALDEKGSHFFIHIDAKVPIQPFRGVMVRRNNIIFVPDRVAVEWGKWSVVQAELRLLQVAVDSGIEFKYYTMLSGSDYPIKDKQAIGVYLRQSDRQHIRIDRKLTSDPENPYASKLENLPDGKYFGSMTPYHGSMFWSLTEDCVRFIFNFVRDNPGYVEIHRHVFAPDEIFFHTLIKHSPFVHQITQDFSDGRYPDHTHHANHFIDWAGLRKRDGLTLDERDLDDLLASCALFARKFDERKSGKLLELLDAHIQVARGAV